MSLSERQDDLIRLLRMRADWRVSELALDLDVSERTILRDLDRLRDRGFDITAMSGPGGGVHLEPTSVLVTSQLDGDDVVSLILSVAIAQALPWMPFAAGASAAMAKIEASLPHKRARQLQEIMMRIMIDEPSSPAMQAEMGPVDPSLARLFEVAFTDQRRIAFSYLDRNGNETDRSVEPHGLLVRAPLWYVIAWDSDKSSERMFRADRISSPRVLAESFVPLPHEVVRKLNPNAKPASLASSSSETKERAGERDTFPQKRPAQSR